jgi:hypothetical protein
MLEQVELDTVTALRSSCGQGASHELAAGGALPGRRADTAAEENEADIPMPDEDGAERARIVGP